ncbi:Gamma-tubulin complex component like [Actinidia chinensis var. chinensis]|uniref:Gamma-tubulin complex component like n=1 Tax=Actinidia chinensis var. chinensis TaxID=1590841 RepID=A0A2R6QRQ0_ACTCC|nr:Gamma-tubulin complex component like [Actinidia chinensis var. chinensis]
MEDDQRVLYLVKELVHRLLSPPNHISANNYTSTHTHQQFVKYAIRILSSRMTPSIAADETAMAESIKRLLASHGNSSDAVTFADLYSKFSTKTAPGSIKNKWSVLYMLKVISEDRKNQKVRSDSMISTGIFASAASGGLPALFDSERNYNSRVLRDREKLEKGRSDGVGIDNSRVLCGQGTVEKGWSGGVLMVSKDPENIRDIAYREFATFLKEENEVSEEVLVRDVLYACQGIDGKFVKFDKNVDGYALPDTSMDRFPAEDVGTVGQAFCAALQDELSKYYKLLAVLEAQSMNPIPLVSESASSGSYLSLRRLSVWFAEPMVKMRLMALLVDSCKVLRGGAMSGAIHMHAQHGDPLVHDFMKQSLHRVCSPLFEMVRSWVLEGELEDIFAEFFILAQPVKAESLWREGYRLHAGMLPSFISQSLAERILRTGKSINFLRVCCEDRGWADAATESAAAAGTTTTRGALGYGETNALESLVTEAAKRIDKHLMDVLYKQYKFKEHCLAIKRYLLLGQGDFVQYLMDTVGPELSEPANTISSFKLACWKVQFGHQMHILEVSWSTFVNEMEAAKDLDDLLAAQETYLDSIVEKALLGERSRTLYKNLFVLFDLILQFPSQADRLYEGIFELQSKTVESCRDKGKSQLHPSDKTSKPGSWVSEGRKALTQRAIEFLRNMEQDLDVIGKEYSSLLEGFISQLPLKQHIDLKFLLFRLDFSEFYSRMHPNT